MISERTKAIVYALSLPCAASAVSTVMSLNDPNSMRWLMNLNVPAWSSHGYLKEKFGGNGTIAWGVHGIIDVSVIAPLVYATQHVWTCSGGLSNSLCRTAMASYFVCFGLCALSDAVFFRRRKLKPVVITSVLDFANAVFMYGVYSRISTPAGIFVLPYTILAGYYALFFYKVQSLNKTQEEE